MRFFTFVSLIAFVLSIMGCMSLPMSKLVSPSDDVKNWAKINKALQDQKIIESLQKYSTDKEIRISNINENFECRNEQDHFNKFYKNLSAVNGKNDVAYKLIDSPVVKNLSNHVYTMLCDTGEPSDLEISAWEFKRFAELLGTNHNGLVSNLKNIIYEERKLASKAGATNTNTDIFTLPVISKIAQPKIDPNTHQPVINPKTKSIEYEIVEKKHNLAIILMDYLKKYGSGEFVDRYGNSISKPKITSSGISDEDIQGLATVFFEAIFDAWVTPPVYYNVGHKVEQSFKPKEQPCKKIKEPDCKEEGSEESVTLDYSRKYFEEYITSGGEKPTSIASEYVKSELVDDQDISADNAKCIQQVTKLAGKGSRSLTGLAFGFLSNVNISFIAGADFGIGDNKTLMHLVQTFAEVSTRRVAEYAAWKVLKKKDIVEIFLDEKNDFKKKYLEAEKKPIVDSIEVILCLVEKTEKI